MMTHDEMIAVIQHHKNGGKVEYHAGEDAMDHKQMLQSLSKTQALDRAELDRSFQHIMKQRDTLVEALIECLEDSEELLAERDWWKNESRCNYQKDHAELVARVEKAKQALAAVKGGSDV